MFFAHPKYINMIWGFPCRYSLQVWGSQHIPPWQQAVQEIQMESQSWYAKAATVVEEPRSKLLRGELVDIMIQHGLVFT